MTGTDHRTMWMRSKELLLYCLIGVLVAAAAILSGIYLTPESAGKWMGFSIMTAFVLGNAIRYSKRFWELRRFWWALGLFVVIHFVVGFTVLLRLTVVPLIDFVVIGIAEYFALDAYLGLSLRKKG